MKNFWDIFWTNIVLFITQPTYLCVHACMHMRMISWHFSAIPAHTSDTNRDKKVNCVYTLSWMLCDCMSLMISTTTKSTSTVRFITTKPECHNSGPWMDHCSINTVCVFYSVQVWGQVHVYLYSSTFKYTFDCTCTLLKYFLIPAGVLVLVLKYQMWVLLYMHLSTYKYMFESTWHYSVYLWFQLEYLYSTCALFKYFMYLASCLLVCIG